MAVTITHFQLHTIPNSKDIVSLVDNVPADITKWYPIYLQDTVKFVRTGFISSNARPYNSSFVYRIKGTNDRQEVVESVGVYCELKWGDFTDIPMPSLRVLELSNDDSFVFTDEVSISDNTQVFEVKSLSGINNLTFNNTPVYVGQIIDIEDANQIEYKVNSEGFGAPYFEMTYLERSSFGNALDVSRFTLNVAGLGIARLVSGPERSNYNQDIEIGGVVSSHNVTRLKYTLEVALGYVNTSAEISLDVTGGFLDDQDWNSMSVNTNTGEVLFSTIGDYTGSVSLDENGKSSLEVYVYLLNIGGTTRTGDLNLNVNSINGDTNLVDPANDSVTININE